MLPVEALREGEEYEVVVTTAGGLWRYRLGDRVRVAWLGGENAFIEISGSRRKYL